MPELRANGVSLYYEEQGSGPAIVGIHGGGSTAAFWSDAAREWGKRGRAIVHDRRGCSRSERPEPYSTDVHQQADDAAALIDALEAAPAIVIGRSYGGAIALDLALRYRDRVRALVQLEGDGGLSLSETAVRQVAELEERIDAAADAGLDTVAETVVRAVGGDAAWEGLPAAAKQALAANGAALVAEIRGGYPDVTVEQLRSIDMPTLLVGGEDSLLDYTEVIERTAAAIPTARVEWIPGGHLVDPAHPVVLRFLDELLL